MLVDIQVLPTPAGTDQDRYAHVDAAIAAVKTSGLHHEVGALGTTVEGDPDQLWPLLRQVHEGCLAAGATNAVTIVKVGQSTTSDLDIDGLTAKHR